MRNPNHLIFLYNFNIHKRFMRSSNRHFHKSSYLNFSLFLYILWRKSLSTLVIFDRSDNIVSELFKNEWRVQRCITPYRYVQSNEKSRCVRVCAKKFFLFFFFAGPEEIRIWQFFNLCRVFLSLRNWSMIAVGRHVRSVICRMKITSWPGNDGISEALVASDFRNIDHRWKSIWRSRRKNQLTV